MNEQLYLFLHFRTTFIIRVGLSFQTFKKTKIAFYFFLQKEKTIHSCEDNLKEIVNKRQNKTTSTCSCVTESHPSLVSKFSPRLSSRKTFFSTSSSCTEKKFFSKYFFSFKIIQIRFQSNKNVVTLSLTFNILDPLEENFSSSKLSARKGSLASMKGC